MPERHSGTLRSLFRRGDLFSFEVHSIMRIMSAFEQQKRKEAWVISDRECLDWLLRAHRSSPPLLTRPIGR